MSKFQIGGSANSKSVFVRKNDDSNFAQLYATEDMLEFGTQVDGVWKTIWNVALKSDLEAKPTIIYSAQRASSTTNISLAAYTLGSTYLIFYANGGMSILDTWGNSYVLNEIHTASNGVTVSADFTNKRLTISVPSGQASNVNILKLK